jgi:hypothetical protein
LGIIPYLTNIKGEIMKEENNVCLSKLESDSTYLSKPKRVRAGKTQEKFIEEVSKIHPEYDFSNTVYVGSKSKLKVVCLKHGEFEILAGTLLKGGKCPYCNQEEARKRSSKSLDTFLEEVKLIHPTYDFSKVEYINNKTKVEVICDIHGSYYTTPNILLRGGKCPYCNREEVRRRFSKSLDTFLNEVKLIHPEYDFSKVEYINSSTKVEVICKEHGSFFAQPHTLLKGCGCMKCSEARRGKSVKLTYDKFKKKLLEQGKGHLHIKEEDYKDRNSPLAFTCDIHGEQHINKAYNLIESRYGCPKCGLEEGAKKSRVPYETFLKKATKKFKGKFTYLEDTYKGLSTKMQALCPKHGIIDIFPHSHISQEYGCYSCMVEASGAYYLDKPTTLYYIKLIKGNEEYFKLGITTTTLETRFQKLHTDGVTYETLLTKTFETGSSAYFLEQHLLHQFSSNKIDFILLPKSGGNSEIFNQDIYENIKQYFV